MKIKLNIPERLILVNLLPDKGSFDNLSIVDALREKLYPTQEEVKEYEIKQEEERIFWNTDGLKQKDFEFTDQEAGFIKKRLTELSDKEELDYNQYLIYKRFSM